MSVCSVQGRKDGRTCPWRLAGLPVGCGVGGAERRSVGGAEGRSVGAGKEAILRGRRVLEIGDLLLVHLFPLETLDRFPLFVLLREKLGLLNLIVHLPIQVLLALFTCLERIPQLPDGVGRTRSRRCGGCDAQM